MKRIKALAVDNAKLGKRETPKGRHHKVLIVDDHPAFQEGLAQIISSDPLLEACGQVGTAATAIAATNRLKPDVVLLDITLPDGSGLDAIKGIKAAHSGVKVLVISMHDEALYANRVLRLGGDGYIMKQEDPSEIVTAIHDVLGGHIYVSEAILAGQKQKPSKTKRTSPVDALSDAQLEILELLGQGETHSEIAKKLKLDPHAVASECENIRTALRLKTENALIRYAVCWVEFGIK